VDHEGKTSDDLILSRWVMDFQRGELDTYGVGGASLTSNRRGRLAWLWNWGSSGNDAVGRLVKIVGWPAVGRLRTA
jgi:hypothetical protein